MEVNKKQLADIFGASIRTIQNWQEQGMPVLRGGGKGIGAHTHSVAIGSHGHTITVNAAGNAENTVKNIAFNYIVRLA